MVLDLAEVFRQAAVFTLAVLLREGIVIFSQGVVVRQAVVFFVYVLLV